MVNTRSAVTASSIRSRSAAWTILRDWTFRSRKPARIGLEAGLLSQWLFSALAEVELPVVCVETRHIQAVLKARINKRSANALKLRDRGLFKEGYRADVTIFNPDDFRDEATYADPHHYPSGVRTTVIVNGPSSSRMPFTPALRRGLCCAAILTAKLANNPKTSEPGGGVAKYAARPARSNQQIQNSWPGRLA